MVNIGSQWKRWDPHIHAPGTILNNQFGDDDPWGKYLTALEGRTPKIVAIAVTDYYVTDTYEEALKHKEAGRLPDVQLIFPNVELRLDVAAKTGFVNVHLLVSPEEPDYLAQLQRILSRLQFRAHNDRYDCTRSDLIRLGKCADASIINEHAALEYGATQYKVNFSELRDVYHSSEWAKKNILIAVAGGTGDGTSGMRQASDKTIRKEIEKFAHIIFSSSTAQREFWLGQRGETIRSLRENYNGCKPCLHGSDAHEQNTVGQPDENRYSWIKGGLEFDALRQACIDPEGRAFVGSEPPHSAMPSQVISHLSISHASWAQTTNIPFNPRLIAIIGARGSGKTALADMLAAGCDSISPSVWSANESTTPSFLARARQIIGDAAVTLSWEGGETTDRSLDGRDADNRFSFPRARYLSQQFVEKLCSSSGVSDGLIREIERVILEAHPLGDREGVIDFAEFRKQRTIRYQQAHSREKEAIYDLSERIALEFEKESWITKLVSQVRQKETLIKGYDSDLTKLIVKGTETQTKRHSQLSEATQIFRAKIQGHASQRRSFVALQDEVDSTRRIKAPKLLRQAKERHSHSGLGEEQWEQFLLIYQGDVDKSLAEYLAWADKQIAKLNGQPVQQGDPNTPLL